MQRIKVFGDDVLLHYIALRYTLAKFMVAIRYYSDTTTRRLLVAYETLATVLPRDACMRGIAIAVLAFLAVCQSVCYVRTL